MTTKTNTFKFAGLELRCVTIDGQPWFVAADVCKMIEITNPAVACRALKPSEQAKFNLGSGRPAIIVTESGLYTLVLRSRKPSAQAFRDWVTGTVLPAIRKDGLYVQGEEKLDLSNDADLAKMTLTVMEALQKKVEEAEARAKAKDVDIGCGSMHPRRSFRYMHGHNP